LAGGRGCLRGRSSPSMAWRPAGVVVMPPAVPASQTRRPKRGCARSSGARSETETCYSVETGRPSCGCRAPSAAAQTGRRWRAGDDRWRGTGAQASRARRARAGSVRGTPRTVPGSSRRARNPGWRWATGGGRAEWSCATSVRCEGLVKAGQRLFGVDDLAGKSCGFFSGRPSQAALLDLVQPAARPVVAFVERLNVAAPGFAPPLVLAPGTRWVEVGALVGLARSLPASGLNEQAPTDVTGFLRKVA